MFISPKTLENNLLSIIKALTIKVKAQLMERDAIFTQSLANNCPM